MPLQHHMLGHSVWIECSRVRIDVRVIVYSVKGYYYHCPLFDQSSALSHYVVLISDPLHASCSRVLPQGL